MAPEKYIRKFRTVATISWLGFGFLAITLMILSVVPRIHIVPFVAIAVGTIPILAFKFMNKVECPRCKHKMKIHSGFPHVIYKCTKCEHVVNTNVYSDF